MAFNPPPNWPTPPEGWSPPPGWQPDPAWGPPPTGWQLWVDDAGQPEGPPRRKRRTGRNILIGAGGALGLFIAIGALGSTATDNEPTFTAGATTAPRAASNTAEPAPTPTPTEEAPVDSDGDGITDDTDAYPADANRHSEDDRDGDGTANATDVAPDDPAVSSWPTDVVYHVVDGDTVDVEGLGRIRIIGIDTPERGECGYQEATDLMEYLVLGKEVTLVPGARDDRDRYNRLLRYIDVDGNDDDPGPAAA